MRVQIAMVSGFQMNLHRELVSSEMNHIHIKPRLREVFGFHRRGLEVPFRRTAKGL
jgi:hypothetical protein